MRILHAIHDFLPRHQAGSEIYACELAHHQCRQGHEVHVLCAEYDGSQPHGSLVWRWQGDLPVTEIINNWHFDSFAETYASEYLGRQLEHVLRAVAPDVLHIHNLLNLSFDLPALAAARGIPSVATLHDFTLLCPSGGQRVHQAEKHVCVEIDTQRCARCFSQSHFHQQMTLARLAGATPIQPFVHRGASLARRCFPRLSARLGQALVTAPGGPPGPSQSDIEQRLARVRDDVYSHVDLFVAPSQALAEDYRRFGLPAEKLRVSDYGFTDLAPRPVARPRERLRVGFVGTLVWHKGAHVLVEAAQTLPPDRFEVLLYGGLETFPDYVAELEGMAEGLPVRFMGGFERDRVADIYAEIDVLVVTSLWPENSPLVIHEAFMAGVPVVGSRMGGTVDLVDHGGNGLLYDAFSAEELATALFSLIDDPAKLAGFVDRLPEVKSFAEDAEQWDRFYEEALAHKRGPEKQAIALERGTGAT